MQRVIFALALLTGIAAQLPATAAPREWREPLTGMVFVEIPKGCFRMGSPTPIEADQEHLWAHLAMTTPLSFDEHPQHEVCLDAMRIGAHEVTAAQWQTVLGMPPPSGRGDMPAAGITWEAAQHFAGRLSEKQGGKGRFRLPTEAEWEYACRAGRGDDPVAIRSEHATFAWYSIRAQRRLEPSDVGKLAANPWGLHDMLGNVWEWTRDAYAADAYARHALFNPLHAGQPGDARIIRGASHRSNAQEVRCANRAWYPAADSLPQIGLRLVWEP